MRVGVDIGGTFTDFVVYDGEIKTFKLPSSPSAPEQAVLNGLERIGLDEIEEVVHGSTVATNAVLERRGARTAFITTEGFRDMLTIGRQNRSELYDLSADRPEPLVPRDLCLEVSERVDHNGQVLIELDQSALPQLARQLRDAGVEAAAICLLFSFLRPEHEAQIATELEAAGIHTTSSSLLLPEFREYERASTTAINAFVMPVVGKYLRRLGKRLKSSRLRIMQSSGGSLSAEQTQTQPARAILSGPAAGAVGALYVSRLAGFPKAIAFDMGGTSTDASLSTGQLRLTSEGQIDGLPLRLPMIDIHTVGSGGGSIARVDTGGSLRVGPQSAGAEPGPACYGRGGRRATVTDANLILGRLAPDRFLGGEMQLDSKAAQRVLNQLASELAPSPSAELAARGVIQVADAHMARALRLVSVARGHDPRDFALVSFGGAGGLHACEVARLVGLRHVLVPPNASTLSAFGMLAADITKDYVQTIMLPASTPFDSIQSQFHELEQRGRMEVEAEGVSAERIATHAELDLRYEGQSYELRLPFGPSFLKEFHEAHQKEYGYADPDLSIEIVNLRLRAIGQIDPPELPSSEITSGERHPEAMEERPVVLNRGDRQLTPFIDGSQLRPGQELAGPTVIAYSDTTVLLDIEDRAKVDVYGNLIVEVAQLQ
jgi:N-methylhydantoinase A